jgi:type IV pilus assembly protein PilB
MKTRIGELLLKHDIISEEQLQDALKLQKTSKRKLGEILLEKGYVNTENLFWMLSEQAEIPYVDVRLEMLDQDLINLFPWKVLRENHILPLYETEHEIFVAVGDPTNSIIIEKMRKFSDKKINISCANPHTIDKLLDDIYQAQESETATEAQPASNTKIVIKVENASIEITDETGKTTKRNARMKIIVDTAQKKKEKK